MAPSLRDAVNPKEDIKRREIRLAKIEEIDKAWDDLFFIMAGEEVFKKIPEDYSSFQKSMRQSLEEARRDLLTGKPITAPPSGNLLNKLGELLSVHYNPPQNGEGMAADLRHLREYYCSDFYSSSVEMALDLSLCKLIGNVKKLYAITSQKGERELARTKKSTKAKKDKTNERKGIVIAIYEHGKTIQTGTKFNRACAIIREQFEDSRGKEEVWGKITKDQKKMPTPSLDSINRWLIEAGICDRDFKKEKRYWIRQT
jgi:hypothetical protein